MSDEKKQAQESPKKGLPLKTMIIIAVMMLAEAGAVVAVMTMFAGPQDVKGVSMEQSEEAAGERPQEIPIISERFTNSTTGRVWVYDTELLIQVKTKHAAEVEAELERRKAEIRTNLSRIFAGAHHAHFNEPGRETLTRQCESYLRDVFGRDTDDEEIVLKVLIPKCLGFPAQ